MGFVVAAQTPSSHAQTLEVSPDATSIFTFSGFEGGPFVPETPTTWTLDDNDIPALDFSVTAGQPWLVVTPSAGRLPGSVVLNRTVDVAASLDDAEAGRLAPGLYDAAVTFTNLTSGAGNTTRAVQLRVAPANFSVTPGFVNASASISGANPAPVTVTLKSNGQADLSYRVTWVERSWFNVDKVAGTVPGGGTDTFVVSFNAFGLAAGTNSAQIAVENTTNGAGSRQLPVSLLVQAGGSGSVKLTPDADLEIHGAAGNLPIVVQTSTLANGSDGTVTWDTKASDNWVSVSPGGGQLAASNGVVGGADEQAIDIRNNAATDDLTAGSHTATVTFQNVNNATNAVTIGTRVVHVIADPVLTVSSPLTGGSVAVAPSGGTVAAGAQTGFVFGFGDVVTLTAIVTDGYQFQGWTADFHLDSDQANPLVVTMDQSRKVTAVIVPVLRTLNLSVTGSGTGTIKPSPTGTIIDNALVSRYNNGTQVKLQADADAGSVFAGWGGNVPTGMESANPLTVVMDRERTITARFERTVTLSVNVTGSGRVTVEPDLDTYATGTAVTLTASPDDGFVFAGWSGDGSGSDTMLTLTLTDDTTVEAAFAVDTGPGDGGGNSKAKLTVEIDGDGVVTPDGGEFDKGTTVTLIATPGASSTFSFWGGDADGVDLTTTVVMDGDRNVRAVFQAASDGGTGRPTPGLGGALCGATGMLGLPAMLAGLALLPRSRVGRSGRVRRFGERSEG
jgi:hypothetical protein